MIGDVVVCIAVDVSGKRNSWANFDKASGSIIFSEDLVFNDLKIMQVSTPCLLCSKPFQYACLQLSRLVLTSE